MTAPARGPAPPPPGQAPAALPLPRSCLACNREQGERMCDLCQRLELAESAADAVATL